MFLFKEVQGEDRSSLKVCLIIDHISIMEVGGGGGVFQLSSQTGLDLFPGKQMEQFARWSRHIILWSTEEILSSGQTIEPVSVACYRMASD